MDKDLVAEVVDAARRVVASGAISANGHGNVSLRLPGAQEMYFTAAPSLRDHPASAVVRVGLDGTLLEGELPPIQRAVVAMHTAMYLDHPDVGCVLHTHSPYATAYAVAGRPIGCWVEAMAMFGLPSGVPVAAYGPRGSDEAVANIRAAVVPGTPAVLLANHGVLVFHSDARPRHPRRRRGRGGGPGRHQREHDRRCGRGARRPPGRGAPARDVVRARGNGQRLTRS
jgi:L-fuculose-phosphate aldolase